MRHLLVPTDFSEAAQAALDYAIELCNDLQGKITLLHVVRTEKVSESLPGLDAIENLSSTLHSPPTSSGFAPAFDVTELQKVALQKLDACVDGANRGQVKVETAVVDGRPAVRIVEFARDHDIDLIVMGTHGRGPVAHFFLGSVAENVIRSAECPVLTIRSKSPDRNRSRG